MPVKITQNPFRPDVSAEAVALFDRALAWQRTFNKLHTVLTFDNARSFEPHHPHDPCFDHVWAFDQTLELLAAGWVEQRYYPHLDGHSDFYMTKPAICHVTGTTTEGSDR
jgi:hypothetical protein